jgi:DNA replication protein DnaC
VRDAAAAHGIRSFVRHASRRNVKRTDLTPLPPLIIDDMGLKSLPPKAGEILLELIMRRYENRSTLMTSNRPIEEWGKLLNDVAAASAILDRFLHHSEIIQFQGKSYRVEQATRRKKTAA